MTTEETPFEIGKAKIFWVADLPVAGIIATGALLHRALVAAKELGEKGISVNVMNLSSIKPLDEEAIIKLAQAAGKIITVEEHQIRGGMGSAVAECLAKNFPVPMEFLGVDEQFGQSGTQDELVAHYGMDSASIIKAVEKLLRGKPNSTF
jgi:transketolase